MKTNKTGLKKILLAMAVALPLCAGAVGANDIDDHGAAMPHGGPDRDGPDAGPRMQGGMPPFGPPGMVGMAARPFFLRSIELSEAQDDKVFAILHEEQPYLREQGRAAAKAQEALRALAGADKYDDAKAASLAQAAATAMANISLQRVRTEQKLLAVLTPEQRKKLQGDKDGRDKPRRPRS
ncbi:protein refolding chaperone Spy/CpxP family [Duganella sp. CF517]|uniref:Spy/CpxP family protein refolding chaperone n=1 Tax=Duganella sp. CF517 TaxID=1881038 RepID=UPI0008D40068|nr:periplasmic heavy metal sensor [Duganella sp. CF517]SEN89819.1 protein refolding chaperone Spy/CpxP family [Duganella sp. CF517]